MTNKKKYTLDIRGQLACFTRPEMKVERVSYEVIAPSAARAIFESVYWKPQIRWRMTQIEVLSPIAFTHIRRCEVSSLASSKKDQIFADHHRQLRSSLVLRDVHYRLTAEMEVFPFSSDKKDSPKKHFTAFERRASRGQCLAQPYLGCREFCADWRLVTENDPCNPISASKDLGMMLFDMDFNDPDFPLPRFFRAILKNGVIDLPEL